MFCESIYSLWNNTYCYAVGGCTFLCCIAFNITVVISFNSSVEIVVVRDPHSDDPRTYSDLTSYTVGAQAYITAGWSEIQLVPPIFTIGDVSAAGDEGYMNVQLKSNTQYGYFIRYTIENDADPLMVRLY